MVNGEDYNNFPFTAYNSIIKSKALNRSSIGTSRYLDQVDNTGKYSSTNVFGSDGALYEENTLPTFLFTWATTNEINDIIVNQVQPLLAASQMQQFYYANFPRPSLTPLNYSWHKSTTIINETTGYFMDSTGTPVSLGAYASNNAKYIVVGSLVKFVLAKPDVCAKPVAVPAVESEDVVENDADNAVTIVCVGGTVVCQNVPFHL